MQTTLKWQKAHQQLPGEGRSREGWDTGITLKGIKKFLGLTDMLSVLIMVMVSCANTYIKIFLIVHFKDVQFLHFNYTSKYMQVFLCQ